MISETIKKLGDNPSREVCWDSFVEAEQDLIIESYTRGMNLKQFKGDWKRRFQEALTTLNYNTYEGGHWRKKQLAIINYWGDQSQ